MTDFGLGGSFGLGGLGSSGGGDNSISNFFGGEPEKFGQMSGYNPENQKQFSDLISQLLGRLGGDEFDFDPIEEQARSGFAQKTLPSIAERFTSMGGGGGRSSAFGQQLGAAGSDLEQSLGSMRQQHGIQRQGLLQQLLGLGKQEGFYQPRTPGWLESLLRGLGQAGGQIGGSAAKSYIGGA